MIALLYSANYHTGSVSHLVLAIKEGQPYNNRKALVVVGIPVTMNIATTMPNPSITGTLDISKTI